ncbi:beta-ketoacyl-ACP synthase III [Tannockella kyphosi]|uniref:beta-ketoacyl-ACP synthase III n=1 Tax=Tannockella kyphosi TaxID=2899121 RepID=UPI0020112ACD|nr:beta-ketoacyl-ACP synthase III [Tannockella kyphosi]
MMGIEILSTGYYVPPKKLTNKDLEKLVDTSDEWIQERTGIHTRHVVDTQNNIDIAYLASKQAIQGIDKKKIGIILVATMSNENKTPSVACMLQEKLGLNDQEVIAFDINVACSGFVYGLEIARGLLNSLEDKYALVVGSEVLSKLIDYTDRSTCILFGDGSGAVVVQASNNKMYSYLDAKGNKEVLCTSKDGYLTMNGTEVFKFATRIIPKCIEKLLEKSNLKIEDIDHFVCHQANYRIIHYVYKKMKIDPQKFYINVQEFGNTSGASIPIALAQMNEQKLIKKGDKVMCIGFGAGLTWGATLHEW